MMSTQQTRDSRLPLHSAPRVVSTEQIRDSRLPLHVNSAIEIVPALATFGEYTIYPMEFCSEDQIARLFSKVAQRGNPVLQGRPIQDLELLGRAMYRKSRKMGMGNVAIYQGEPVALGCSWDMAEGGAWEGSGLEMPASMEAHAAAGRAAFEGFAKREKAKSTFFSGFYGVLPPHSIALFGYLGFANLCLAHMLGFEDSFQYTLIPALTKKGLWTEKDTNPADNMTWPLRFADVPSSDDAARAELGELDGNINLSLIRLGYMMGPEYKKMAAGIVGMKANELFEPSQMIAANHLKWLRSRAKEQRLQSHSFEFGGIAARL
jgi:hypothetical protein